MLDRRRFSEFWAISVAFSGGADCSLLDLGLSLAPLSEVAVAGFCDWAAMSLREALPRFLRSRLYSHVRPNSVCHDALATSSLGWASSSRRGQHTHTMRARSLAIALCSQLVALVARPADSSSHRGSVAAGLVGGGLVLCTLGLVKCIVVLGSWVQVRVVELLQCVLRSLGQSIKARHGSLVVVVVCHHVSTRHAAKALRVMHAAG